MTAATITTVIMIMMRNDTPTKDPKRELVVILVCTCVTLGTGIILAVMVDSGLNFVTSIAA